MTGSGPSGDLPQTSFWRRQRAHQMSVVINGSPYYRAAKEAMLKAQHSVMLIGWDFDARVELEPDEQTLDGPSKIGDFLNWLVDHRPGLQVKLLKWDLGMLRSLGRGETPLFVLNWLGHQNLRLRLDSAHPSMAAHHMKLLVVDDVLAFCGGIDMTVGRWDTREHLEADPNRKSLWGRQLPPWHDVTTCIEGPVVAELAALARERWFKATGEELQPAPTVPSIWPSTLPVQFRDVEVAIARTSAAYKQYPEVCEIESATLELIGRAERTIYIENQYLASRHISEALAERLREENGPEIVLVMPQTADGWLEAKAMDSARSRLLHLLRDADQYDRFRAFFPRNASGTPVYVHAKVLIADDRYLKIGSANLNNRSMGYDTECDVLIDAAQAGNPAETSEQIAGCRTTLLSEHLDVSAGAIQAALAEKQSLVAAIESLNTSDRLSPIVARPLKPAEKVIAETDLVDPERPSGFWETCADVLFHRTASSH